MRRSHSYSGSNRSRSLPFEVLPDPMPLASPMSGTEPVAGGVRSSGFRSPRRQLRRGVFYSVASIFGLLSVGNTQASAQTLTQALAEAYNTNPALLAQRALLRATDE